MIIDTPSVVWQQRRRWLRAWCRVESGAHGRVLKYDIILPSAGSNGVTFEEENISEKARRHEKPRQCRKLIVNDKSKVSIIDIGMT